MGKRSFTFILTLIPLLGWITGVQAEDFKNLKGAREFIHLKPECEYLSPDLALGITRNGELLNNYLYGDPTHPAIMSAAFAVPVRVVSQRGKFSDFVILSTARKNV